MVISGPLTTPAHYKMGEQRHDIMAFLRGPCINFNFYFVLY